MQRKINVILFARTFVTGFMLFIVPSETIYRVSGTLVHFNHGPVRIRERHSQHPEAGYAHHKRAHGKMAEESQHIDFDDCQYIQRPVAWQIWK